MTGTRKALVAVALLALSAVVWVWWNRPRRVDMAAYVPADAVVYLEANSLPGIAEGLTSTAAWRELVTPGAEKGWGWAGRLGRFAALTGVGSGEAVVLARAQVAVVVFGFKAEEAAGAASITFAPRVAVVAETHTGEWRARAAVEKLVGDFARHSFGEARVERRELDGVLAAVWAEADGSRRRIVVAVREGLAVVGNDEAVVRACLDVRRGARQSLAGNPQLEEMRARLEAGGALAFGFAPEGSAAKAVEVLAPALAGGAVEEPRLQSMMATLLPKVSAQLVKGVGWSARSAGGSVEDRYLVLLPGGMAGQLRGPLATVEAAPYAAAGLLPRDTYDATFYHFRNPEFAWRGLHAALSSHVDVTSAAFISLLLQSSLKSYDIEEPREFLRHVGSEVMTARLAEADEGKVLIVEMLDRGALRAHVLRQTGVRPEQLDGAELFVARDPERAAAALVGNHLLLGAPADVRRCLAARQEGRTLREAAAFKGLAGAARTTAFAQSLTDDTEAALAVAASLSGRTATRPPGAFHSVAETRLNEVGIERRTVSAFGLFGELAARLGRGK